MRKKRSLKSACQSLFVVVVFVFLSLFVLFVCFVLFVNTFYYECKEKVREKHTLFIFTHNVTLRRFDLSLLLHKTPEVILCD